MLCVAQALGRRLGCRPTVLVPPLGYVPCGMHLPGIRVGRKQCNYTGSASLLTTELVNFDLLVDVHINATKGAVRPCLKSESVAVCRPCSAVSKDVIACVQQGLAESERVHVTDAFGTSKRQDVAGLSTQGDQCAGAWRSFSTLVESYTSALRARLHLRAGEFVAAQYRTGLEWRGSMVRDGHAWGCYGMASVNNSLLRVLGMDALRLPRFVMTNQPRSPPLHDPSVPVPLAVLSEIRLASQARLVMLNPFSSFQQTIERLRASRGSTDARALGVDLVRERDVADDCEACVSANEPPPMGYYAKLCSAPTPVWEHWRALNRQRRALVTVQRKGRLAREDCIRSNSSARVEAAKTAQAEVFSARAARDALADGLFRLLNETPPVLQNASSSPRRRGRAPAGKLRRGGRGRESLGEHSECGF